MLSPPSIHPKNWLVELEQNSLIASLVIRPQQNNFIPT